MSIPLFRPTQKQLLKLKEKGLLNREIGEIFGVDRQTISNWLHPARYEKEKLIIAERNRKYPKEKKNGWIRHWQRLKHNVHPKNYRVLD